MLASPVSSVLYIMGKISVLNHSTLFKRFISEQVNRLDPTLTSAVLHRCSGCGGTNAADEAEDEQV